MHSSEHDLRQVFLLQKVRRRAARGQRDARRQADLLLRAVLSGVQSHQGEGAGMNVVPKLIDLLSDHAKAPLVPSEAISAMRGELAKQDTLLLPHLLGANNNGNAGD